MTAPSAPTPPRGTLLLLDGSWALFRSFYAIRGMRAPDGRSTGALYGLLRQLEQLRQRFAPTAIAIAFDETDTGFRVEIDPTYKGNRGETPPELAIQWPIALQLLDALGLRVLRHGRWEADDLIATAASRAHAAGWHVVVASADKDLGQLVRDGVPAIVQYDPPKEAVLDEAAIVARWGVAPSAIPHVQALVGDAVDNIKGVTGIGAKTASKLIAAHGDLDGLYGALERVTPPRTQLALRDGEADARRCLQLCTLHVDADLCDLAGNPVDLIDFLPRSPDAAAVAAFAVDLGFGRILSGFGTSAATAAGQAAARGSEK